MAKVYTDGAALPYRITYYRRGTGTNELRYSDQALAQTEATTMIRRGYVVTFDVWNADLRKYVTQNAYN